MNTSTAVRSAGAPTADPLAQRLLHYAPLNAAELAQLDRLAVDGRSVKAGAALIAEGGASDHIFVLRSGVMYASTLLQGGARQILRIHHPGDLMNLTCVGWTQVSATLTAVTDADVTRFPRTMLAEIFLREPRLAALFYGMAVIDHVSLADRLKSLGRTDGRARIAALLLELNTRQRITEGEDPDMLELHLTQGEIADAVGMTKVHVNRLLKELTDEGLIAREGRRVRLCDREALVRTSGFFDRFSSMETDWLPPPARSAP